MIATHKVIILLLILDKTPKGTETVLQDHPLREQTGLILDKTPKGTETGVLSNNELSESN